MSRRGYFTGDPGTTKALIGPDGKPLVNHWGPWPIPLFEYRMNLEDPLTFHWRGQAYQPDRHVYPSDGGSIPPPLWIVPGLSPWNRPRAYPNHDCGFRYGGLYVLPEKELILGAPLSEFRFRLLPREALNELLGEMVVADGAGWLNATIVNAGVRLGSRYAWHEDKQAKNREEAGIIVGEQHA